MKITVQELLPANLSDEAALHIVNFIRALALAIESIYFDRLLLKSASLSTEELETPIRFNPDSDPF
jgi:hypothetical protein